MTMATVWGAGLDSRAMAAVNAGDEGGLARARTGEAEGVDLTGDGLERKVSSRVVLRELREGAVR